jgi:hypothetical protein
MKPGFSRQIFEKPSDIKFHENIFRASRVVPCGQTDGQTDGRTGITKLIVAFRYFVNAPKMVVLASFINLQFSSI